MNREYDLFTRYSRSYSRNENDDDIHRDYSDSLDYLDNLTSSIEDVLCGYRNTPSADDEIKFKNDKVTPSTETKNPKKSHSPSYQSIETCSDDASEFLTEFRSTIIWEKIYKDDYDNLVKEFNSCKVKLKSKLGDFYNDQEQAWENVGNVFSKGYCSDSRHNLESALDNAEILWDKVCRKIPIEKLDSLKRRIIANKFEIKKCEEKERWLFSVKNI